MATQTQPESWPIEHLSIRGYGCIQNASFRLTPLHALIGPNDSGKSTTLRALRVVCQFAAGTFDTGGVATTPFDPRMTAKDTRFGVDVRFRDGLAYDIFVDGQGLVERISSARGGRPSVRAGWNHLGLLASNEPDAKPLAERLRMATLVRFDPNALRRPAALLDGPIAFREDTGLGLAAVYQALNSREVDKFIAIRERVRNFFPTVDNLQVLKVGSGPNGEALFALQVRLRDGTLVDAGGISEGLLYFLGFAALECVEGSKLFLIEEPENGLHPSRIAEVIGVLRNLSKSNQVVLATHSPLVINELKGEEISVVTRHSERGTQVKLLCDVPGYEEAMKVYLPGEFWVSYADGEEESALLQGTARK